MPLNNFGFLFSDSPNPMWIYALDDFRILKANKAAVNHYGYSHEDFERMRIFDLRPPEDQQKLKDYLNDKLSDLKKAGQNGAGVWRHIRKDGSELYAEIISNDVKYEGKDCRIVVVVDVTEKVRFQQELMRTKLSLEALINNTEDQIWSVDANSRYVYMNNAYRRQIAYLSGVEPVTGGYSFKHAGYNEEIIARWKGYYDRALEGEVFTTISESTDPATNEVLSFEVSFHPIYDSEGTEISGVGCFARDITQRIKTEKAIIDQNERLRHIASLTSHELRRPVASMLGLINIMDRNNFFNPDNKEIIEHMLTVGNEIDEVIRLIIDKTFITSSTTTNKF